MTSRVLRTFFWPLALVACVSPGLAQSGIIRVEQNNPALNYAGTWYPHTNPQHSGGSALLAVDAGSRSSINFIGTGITWNAYRDEYSGIAKIYLDGVLQPPVATYLSPAQVQSPAYAINGLPSGTHSLTVEVTGTRNERPGGSWIWVDAFDVPGNGAVSVISGGVPLPSGGPAPLPSGLTRMEQDNSAITFLGTLSLSRQPAGLTRLHTAHGYGSTLSILPPDAPDAVLDKGDSKHES